MPTVALVTATDAEPLDEDLPPLVAALAERGADVRSVVWDDPAVDWASVDVAVIRSTWDYHGRRDEFCAWADAVGAATVLCNPAPIVRWNTDKRYLSELSAAGIDVVPTVFLVPGDEVRLVDAPEVVVKPAVSAGSRDTARHSIGDAEGRARARRHARELLDAGRVVMVQPYLDAVDDEGETAVICIDGVVSHAIRKGPLLRAGDGPTRALFAEEQISARDPRGDELRLARATLEVCAARFGAHALLYARVDLIPGPTGDPVLLELELTEPSLFFDTAPGSADRFAAAVIARAR